MPRLPALAAFATIAAFYAPLSAQLPQAIDGAEGSDRPLSSLLYGRGGFALDSVTASGAYFSRGLTGNNVFLPSSLARSGDGMVWGAASASWSRPSERSHIGLSYSPSYFTFVPETEFGSWNHSLTFTASRRLSRKWRLGAGLNGTYADMNQLMFSPGSLATAVALPGQYDDYATALLRGPITGDAVASNLSGATAADTPARSLFFGNRVLTAAANVSLGYAPSTRTTFTVAVGATRMQPIANDDARGLESELAGDGILGHVTAGSVTATLAYALSPRTQIGVSADVNRVYARLQDAYRPSASGFIGRRMGRRWFVQGHGGGGAIVATREVRDLPAGAQYRAGGSIGFIARTHTFIGAASRNFGDQFGIGAGSTIDLSAAWRWAPAWRTWSVRASFSQQRLQATTVEDINSWQAAGGVTKAFGRHFATSVEYAYIGYGLQTGLFRRVEFQGVRGSVTWVPGGIARRPER